MKLQTATNKKRRAVVVIFIAILLIMIMAMAAFAIDIGWIAWVRTQLQVAADAAAMAAAGELNGGQTKATTKAKGIAALNTAGGPTDFVTLADSDIVFGAWDSTAKTFTSSSSSSANAVKVTARRTLPLFFAPTFANKSVDVQASAIAVANPRDIVFVIDLSGSMNNDTEIWATASINTAFSGYPTIGTDIMQNVFTDFGFGTYPGTSNHIGQGFIPNNQLTTNAYNYLANTYLLNNNNVTTTYRVSSGDSSSTRKTKAYKFLIDKQLATLMPKAKPTPSSSNSSSLSYWTDYLDYVIDGGKNGPPNQDSYQIDSGANPYGDAWPDLTSSSITGFSNKIGYQTYVQFLMDYGWNKQAGGQYTQISRLSDNCPWNTDTDPNSPGYGFQFPPREQPTHSVRLAVMAAIAKIASLNVGLSETSKDHVGVVTFDTASGVTVKYPLSISGCDYNAAKGSLCDIQCVADDTLSTASENGLIAAKNMLDPSTNPTGARPAATKFVIFLTDGIPNIKSSSNSTITNYANSHTKGEWFGSVTNQYERNSVLMQTDIMQALGWKVNAIAIGLGADRSMMDRMARMGGTAQADPTNVNGPKISAYATGNPADYQTRLTGIFQGIVGASNVKVVK
jgi:Flp pilus assembly protein TadG